MTFEEGTKKLEEIISALDSEKTTLEQSIALFEEGVKISKECLEILNTSKGKITIIKEQYDGIVEVSLQDNV
ncbi:MAG: exodeoxyribonuclease VII small subunit [Clostridia bacterium]|nr:exodeoxyribonuclease VII small subunit [Clostridia bacterium]MBR2397801.1 exodeoxyribonuclease VII small subunit [Clostridia bacterium]MBR2496171.1 exodeoxyribonuclease VII small subunit [Clostridia bacterium]